MPTPQKKTRKRISKSPNSNSPNSHKNRIHQNRERELVERAKQDSDVHKQLIQLMEEDEELIEIYSKHLQRKYGKKWDNLSTEMKAKEIQNIMKQYRIPQSNRSGGKRTKRRLRKRGKSRKTRRYKK